MVEAGEQMALSPYRGLQNAVADICSNPAFHAAEVHHGRLFSAGNADLLRRSQSFAGFPGTAFQLKIQQETLT